ncbi:MAG: adenylate kinase [Candidatus Kerfeldbacteria bacterium CG15_BIG_FIL_POST_REV_8_21_14_020_45_12]|uniref:Adenylate kinase n=1 Tax=Candidatus Kerfeldbacteria bacterium CG15_BIG_FIL_POST_REV_8_21_14_020_45_12 TaxID=2014247 RepID=A0A2M7H3T3_9BACT|nr:MAG: adenylate kinase [Candidatus Kerfeldbacteria bacterium CG15_BIG_FIL_POST_REV_8_21_14_020_45_12]PJA94004.1 MAG: adenylate kinase [Candidatus Kerfeldbacteria bacterium CG_4_9_14_3_um_filter_45_8]
MVDETTPKKICLFGPQGSGKGTQAERLVGLFGVPHVSPGNIFRQAVAEGSELGLKVESIINSGSLVPDEVTNQLVKERLELEDCLDGFVLDGYPRNEVQAVALDEVSTLTHVIVIEIPDEESISRISMRRTCSNCGMTYHLQSKPSKVEGVCDSCGSELVQRDDDKPEAIRHRLNIYHQETEPLIKRYEDRGVLHRIDGRGSIDAVWERVQSCFFS